MLNINYFLIENIYIYIYIYAFKCESFKKLCENKLLRFQWKTERDFFLVFLDLDLGQYAHDILTKNYNHFSK